MTAEWNEKKEKKILRRYRFTLTLRIIRVAFIVLFVYWAYMMVVTISFHQSTKGEKLAAFSQLAVDWQYPGVSSDFLTQRVDISPFLTQTTSIPIYRKIGKEQKDVGYFEVKKKLLTNATNVNYEFYQKSDKPEFSFWLPIHPETGRKLEANEHSGVWETLEKIHEGTVADLAFSTKKYMSQKELFLLLDDYDVDVVWMPIYMGELDIFSEGWWGGSNSVSVYPWGLTNGREFDSDYRNRSKMYPGQDNIEMIEQLMLANMKRLYNDDPKLAEAIFRTRHFEERLQYLEENGFKVYGAVVTGPTKELLRLQGLEEIQGVQLGKISFWNWEENK